MFILFKLIAYHTVCCNLPKIRHGRPCLHEMPLESTLLLETVQDRQSVFTGYGEKESPQWGFLFDFSVFRIHSGLQNILTAQLENFIGDPNLKLRLNMPPHYEFYHLPAAKT